MRAGSLSFPLFSQLFVLAFLFLSVTPTRASFGIFDWVDDVFDIVKAPHGAKKLKGKPTPCDCLDSISLPGFTGYLDSDDFTKNQELDLDVTYNVAKCKNRAVRVALKQKQDNQWKAGCCKNEREGFQLDVDLFYGYSGKNSELDLSIYLGGGPGKNKCSTKPKEICTKKAIEQKQKFYFEVSVDGCNRKKTYEFMCIPKPEVSQKKKLAARHEAALGLPPRHMRCPTGSQTCRVEGPGNRWECLKADDIESCGGCPGSQETQDCTELPGVSAVQCLNKQCVVAKCLRGHSLVDNECVKDAVVTQDQKTYRL